MNLVRIARNSKRLESFVEFFKSNLFAKIIGVVITWGIALIPLWIYMLSHAGLNPVGFWQELVLILAFMFVLGWVQFVLILLGVVVTYSIITDDNLL